PTGPRVVPRAPDGLECVLREADRASPRQQICAAAWVKSPERSLQSSATKKRVAAKIARPDGRARRRPDESFAAPRTTPFSAPATCERRRDCARGIVAPH